VASLVTSIDGLSAIAPGVFVLTAYGSRVFLLRGGEHLALVDTGRRGGARRILRTVTEAGYRPDDLSLLVITHHHLDHIGSLAALRASTGAKVAAHRLEAPLIAGDKPLPNPFQLPILARAMQPLVALGQPKAAPVDVLLEEGDALPGLPDWQVLHTPGHTPGSICLWRSKDGVLVAGDALEYRRGRLTQPSRLFTADMDQAKASIARLARLDVNVLCLSHFSPLTDAVGILMRALASSLSAH
jgi:glyoxylase-like metal-dependent hydrolase (beta-lactamase superfamily II)